MTTLEQDRDDEITLQRECDELVRREVYYCVSNLVDTLAHGYGATEGDIGELCEEAMELCSPVLDYCEAAGWHARNTSSLDELREFLVESDNCIEDHDDINDMEQSVAATLIEGDEDLSREYLDEIGEKPYEREILEHWVISNWLARRLRERGERIGRLADMEVWGRCCTGQAISMDDVIQGICRDLMAPRAA